MRVSREAKDEGSDGDADASDERRVQAGLGPALGDVGAVQAHAVLVHRHADHAADELRDVDHAAFARVELVDAAEDVRDRDEEEV